jgi:hypothetical protein
VARGGGGYHDSQFAANAQGGEGRGGTALISTTNLDGNIKVGGGTSLFVNGAGGFSLGSSGSGRGGTGEVLAPQGTVDLGYLLINATGTGNAYSGFGFNANSGDFLSPFSNNPSAAGGDGFGGVARVFAGRGASILIRDIGIRSGFNNVVDDLAANAILQVAGSGRFSVGRGSGGVASFGTDGGIIAVGRGLEINANGSGGSISIPAPLNAGDGLGGEIDFFALDSGSVTVGGVLSLSSDAVGGYGQGGERAETPKPGFSASSPTAAR